MVLEHLDARRRRLDPSNNALNDSDGSLQRSALQVGDSDMAASNMAAAGADAEYGGVGKYLRIVAQQQQL